MDSFTRPAAIFGKIIVCRIRVIQLSPKLTESALSTSPIEPLSRQPIFSLSRCLSMVLTCSSKTIESFASPQPSAFTEICVGRFVLSRWLVIAAAITVGLYLFPTSFCIISLSNNCKIIVKSKQNT